MRFDCDVAYSFVAGLSGFLLCLTTRFLLSLRKTFFVGGPWYAHVPPESFVITNDDCIFTLFFPPRFLLSLVVSRDLFFPPITLKATCFREVHRSKFRPPLPAPGATTLLLLALNPEPRKLISPAEVQPPLSSDINPRYDKPPPTSPRQEQD